MSLGRTTDPRARLLGTTEVFVADSIVSPDEQAILIKWADQKCEQNRLLLNPRDSKIRQTPYRSADGELSRLTKGGIQKGRTTKDVVWVPSVSEQVMDQLPDAFWKIRARVIDLLELGGLEEDHYKGSFLTYIAPGGKVHEHVDAKLTIAQEEFLILRCNVLFKRPVEGGLPVICSRELNVPDRGMWAFYPTELAHSATEVCGPVSRGSLSFGFLVRPLDLLRRRFRRPPGLQMRYEQSNSEGEIRHSLIVCQGETRYVVGVHTRQVDVVRFVASQTEDFTAEETAEAVLVNPSDACDVLRDLQRLNFVQSYSSMRSSVGKVLLF